MLDTLLQLGLFTAKSIIIVALVLVILVAFFGLLARSKDKLKGRLIIKHLNKTFAETKEVLLEETLTKKEFKQFLKTQKAEEKSKAKANKPVKKMFVLNFQGDMKASAVSMLSEEITALLNITQKGDEVLLKLESPGGVVHGYGLAAAQLMRFRNAGIPLTICVDKVAASGGYMMACIADKILAAPFAIIGSIGVIVQLPNFHRLLKDKHIDFEQHTAGDFKRTITVFGQNTEEGREKLQEEIENIHQQFKDLIKENRPQLDIDKVATGEHWLGREALGLKLVDDIMTSDEYILDRTQKAAVYEIYTEVKKPMFSKFTAAANMIKEHLLGM
ncbi:MAG: protease SohB [Gammaproteobacteria bacterium]